MRKENIFEKSMWFIFLFFICGIVVYGIWKKNNSTNDEIKNQIQFPIRNFTLINQYGNEVAKNNFKNKITIVDFIFTNCSGTCPMMTGKMLEFFQMFKYEDNVKFLSISVDPKNDTPQKFLEYASQYGVGPKHQGNDSTKWQFLTGDRKYIYDLSLKDFKLAFDIDTTQADYILHSQKFILLNPNAEIIGYYDSEDENKMKELYFTIKKFLIQNK